MKNVIPPLRVDKIMRSRLFLSVFLGTAFGISIYNYFLIRIFPPTSKRVFFIMFASGLIGALGYFLLLDRWTVPIFSKLRPLQQWVVVGASIFLGAFMMLVGTNVLKSSPDNIIFLLPNQTVEISVPASQAIPNPEIVIDYFYTTTGDVAYGSIEYHGWSRSGNQLVLNDLSNNSFHWTGKTGQKATLVFLGSPQGGTVNVSWNGSAENVNLFRDKKEKYLFNHTFPVPIFSSRAMVLILAALNFIFVFCALILFVWKERKKILHSLSDSLLPLEYSGDRQIGRGSGTNDKDTTQKWAVIIGIMIAALLLRVFFLGRAYLYIDEFSHLDAAKEILSGSPLGSVYQRSLYTVTLPITLFIQLFGFNLLAAKLPGVIINALAIIPLYLTMEKVNRGTAVLSCILYAASPWIISTARNVREYAYYPFYFYWVVYGLIVVLEHLPSGLILVTGWRKLARWRNIVLMLGLLMPLIYGITIDNASSFKVITLVYGVFFLFLLAKFNLKYRSNILLFGLAASGLVIVGMIYLSEHKFVASLVSFQPGFNLYLLRYFLFDPPQQVYFGRPALVFVGAFVSSLILSATFYRHNFIPLFLSALFFVSLIFFTLFFTWHPRPRYVHSLEFWYVPLLGIGLYGAWSAIRPVFNVKPIVGSLVALSLLTLTVNTGQVLLPTYYDKHGFMPVTEEYEYNMQPVETLLLAEARRGDILIATIYGKYASWRGVPDMQIYHADDKYGEQLRQYVYSIVELHDTGWIVLDTWQSSMILPMTKFERGNKTIEFIGLLEDQIVWRWHTNR